MATESTTDDSNSTDDFDLSGEDHVGNDSNDSTDDQQTGDSADDLTSNDDSADQKTEDKTPAFDDDLDAWAEKTGHDKPETERERRLLQDLRDSKREFTRERQTKKTADLQKAIKEATPEPTADDVVDPLEKEVQRLAAQVEEQRTTQMQKDFFREHGITDDEVAIMGEILKDKATQGNMKAFEALADPENLGDLYDLMKIRLSKEGTDTSEVIEKAKKEERERLAKESKSGGPNRSAKSAVSAGKKDELTEMWLADD